MVATAPGSCESLFLPPRDVLALRAAAEGSKKTPPRPPGGVFLKSGRLTGQASGAEHSTVNYAVTDGRRGRAELPLNQKRANGVGTLSRLSRSIAFLLSRVRSRLGEFRPQCKTLVGIAIAPLRFSPAT